MRLLVVQEMTLGLIFSKDRAMQLDATLASFFTHAKDASVIRMVVLYKTSTEEHQAQYELLKKEYAGRVEFIPEIDFRRQVLELLISALPSAWLQRWYRIGQRIDFSPLVINPHSSRRDAGYVLFLVDDNIFVRSFEASTMTSALEANPDALGFSLRLGTNTTYCYAMNTSQTLPKFESLPGETLKFNWTKSENDFAYPLEVSSSLYSIKTVLDMFIGLKFKNPNTLELEISKRRSRYKRKLPALLCHKISVTFCAPINRVQNIYPNRAGQAEEFSPEHLAKMFSQGSRIDVNAFCGFIPYSCHQEVELKFLTK